MKWIHEQLIKALSLFPEIHTPMLPLCYYFFKHSVLFFFLHTVQIQKGYSPLHGQSGDIPHPYNG